MFGFDLDNTLIDYSASVRRYSLTFLETKFENISQLRKFFKEQNQRIEWQKAQSWLYTEGLEYAELSAGAADLFWRLNKNCIPFCVISHKTIRTPKDFGYLDLRKPATHWIQEKLEPNTIAPVAVHFEVTRQKKLERIKELEVTHFIDDLIEVLQDSEFPRNVRKILYDPFEVIVNQTSNIQIINRFDQL